MNQLKQNQRGGLLGHITVFTLFTQALFHHKLVVRTTMLVFVGLDLVQKFHANPNFNLQMILLKESCMPGWMLAKEKLRKMLRSLLKMGMMMMTKMKMIQKAELVLLKRREQLHLQRNRNNLSTPENQVFGTVFILL